MGSEIELEHAIQYEKERNKRWGMAEGGEEIAIQRICELFSRILQIDSASISYERLDDIWFEHNDINLAENEWVKGVSDYLITIVLNQKKYLLVEIKLKSEEYRKTMYGGTTRNGSRVSNYGCSSYYLDVVPVHRNMNDFASRTNTNFSSFIIAFVKDDFSEINIISLAKINDMIENGWRKNDDFIPICTFGEGYGKVAYLIPKSSTTNGKNITKSLLERILLTGYPSPSKILE